MTRTSFAEGDHADASSERAALSPRLDQTLQLLLDGQSEKEVANVLGLSTHTVHVYVKQLRRHFQVRTRAELMAHLYKRMLRHDRPEEGAGVDQDPGLPQ
jgi:DNA-binding NarL/FixJ family response regulator